MGATPTCAAPACTRPRRTPRPRVQSQLAGGAAASRLRRRKRWRLRACGDREMACVLWWVVCFVFECLLTKKKPKLHDCFFCVGGGGWTEGGPLKGFGGGLGNQNEEQNNNKARGSGKRWEREQNLGCGGGDEREKKNVRAVGKARQPPHRVATKGAWCLSEVCVDVKKRGQNKIFFSSVGGARRQKKHGVAAPNVLSAPFFFSKKELCQKSGQGQCVSRVVGHEVVDDLWGGWRRKVSKTAPERRRFAGRGGLLPFPQLTSAVTVAAAVMDAAVRGSCPRATASVVTARAPQAAEPKSWRCWNGWGA